ncbi:MFS transporter [Brevibacillus ruminantium]|uniref:MFS transporter n=1 Tax=Brevibacillus ruminantium TaxID=2950604 RepID=A0ABY4WHR4_9BACL|nr:MFS transporter [Brevibacillus ruminantium]USG66675.1 MFS transporter [Brevibacillus ruminantium]
MKRMEHMSKQRKMHAPRGKTEVIMLAMVTALCMMGDSMLYVVLPLYWQEAGLDSLWQVGVLLSINRFIRVPLNPLVSKWYEHSGGRSGLLLAVVLAVVSTAAYSLQGFWLWLIMRGLWGLAWTFLRLGAYSLIVEVSDDGNRGHLMGLYNGLYRLGSLVGMVGGAILAAWGGITVASLVFAVASLLAFFPVLFIRPSFGTAPNRTGREAVSPFHWKKSMAVTMLTGLFVAMCFQGMFTASLSRLIEYFHPTILVSGLVVGAAVLAGVVQGVRWLWEPWAAPWFGRLSDRYGRRRLFVMAMLAASVLFGSAAISLPLSLFLLVLLGIQFSATILTTVMDTLAADEAARMSNRSSTMMVYSVMTDLGAALGPLLAFWLEEGIGLPFMYAGISFSLLLVTFGWLGKRGVTAHGSQDA